jgi:hypothetical protein
MRSLSGALVLGTISGSIALAGDSVSTSPPTHTVYLSGPTAWAELRASSPARYARAQKIVAAADQLCKPGPAQTRFARFNAQDIACERMLLFTSLPPKHRLSFRLDDTVYIAMVVITDQKPRLIPLP